MATRSLYEILVTGAVNSDESLKAREAGWLWTQACVRCQFGARRPMTYTRMGLCLSCWRDDHANEDAYWHTDAALSGSVDPAPVQESPSTPTKHWHLTGSRTDVRDFGNKIETEERAKQLARVYRPIGRKVAGKPVLVVECTRECVDQPVPGRRLG